jgi:3-dehydroquinate dehydratase/shikimate dehydrogenase
MASGKPRSVFGPDRICAVVAASTAREMAAQLRRALKLTRTVELRLDWLDPDVELHRFLARWPRGLERATLIATCRRKIAGGRFAGGYGLQLTILRLAVGRGCRWCDLEQETEAEAPPGLTRSLLGKARRLASWHDFRCTPAKLRQVARRLDTFGADAIKVATQCHSYADSLRVLALTKGRRNVVAVPMGQIGLPGRLLALQHGSALAYASVGAATAPGQVSLQQMKKLYRADRLDRHTRVYGVIGNPVHHSLSPLMHNTAFIARRMNDVYLPFLVPDLRDFLRAVGPLRVAGFSVTLPHKQAILRHLDDCDPLAASIGAVNTVVVRPGGKLYGYNTDYVGVLRALQHRVALRGSRVLIFGAGGAARAVAFALAQAGAVVAVCARNLYAARRLAHALGGEAVERRRLRREFFDAIVNATPVGMHPHTDASPLAAAELNCRMVFDLVYRPMKTRLLALAERRGMEIVSGVDMFVAQGSAQWEIWTGLRAPEKRMRRVVVARLREEEHRNRK